MRSHYDFSHGVRGKYAKRFRQATNLVVLAADVQRAFPSSNAVNKALWELIKIAAKSSRAVVI